MTLRKQELVDQVYEQSGMPRKKCVSIVESAFEIIKEELERGNDVSISGFGKWMVKEKLPRKGRNPRTGESITISGRKVVTFKSSYVLRDQCNQ